jgi:hypothetical protein
MGAEGAPTPDWDINNKAYNALAFLFLNNMIEDGFQPGEVRNALCEF